MKNSMTKTKLTNKLVRFRTKLNKEKRALDRLMDEAIPNLWECKEIMIMKYRLMSIEESLIRLEHKALSESDE